MEFQAVLVRTCCRVSSEAIGAGRKVLYNRRIATVAYLQELTASSDGDIITDIFDPHNYTRTPEQAVADALNAGTNLDYSIQSFGGPSPFYPTYLNNSLAQGLINESALDRSLVRLYSSLV